MPLFPTHSRETQDDSMEFSSNGYDYEFEDLHSEHINDVRSHNHQYKPMLACIFCYHYV